MSAYVVDDSTINRIAWKAWRPGPTNDTLGHFGKALRAAANEAQPTPDELGKALFAMNCRAVDARYGPGEAATFRDLDYLYKADPATMIVAYKAVQCLLYQCSEGDVPSEPLYKALEAFRDALAREIVESLPDYDQAPWRQGHTMNTDDTRTTTSIPAYRVHTTGSYDACHTFTSLPEARAVFAAVCRVGAGDTLVQLPHYDGQEHREYPLLVLAQS